jgi:hypothetical protein
MMRAALGGHVRLLHLMLVLQPQYVNARVKAS